MVDIKKGSLGVLTYVNGHSRYTVYLDDELVYHGNNPGGYGLLQCLGYEIKSGFEVDDGVRVWPCPPEFTSNEYGWLPPESLKVLQSQQARWRDRTRREEIARLEKELARLRAEEYH